MAGVPAAPPTQLAVAAPQTGGSAAPQQALAPPSLRLLPLDATPPAAPALPGPNAAWQQEYPHSQLVRISIKLFNCEPDQLSPFVYQELKDMLAVAPDQVEAYVRPGCAHLILDIRMPAGETSPSTASVIRAAQAIIPSLPTGARSRVDQGHEGLARLSLSEIEDTAPRSAPSTSPFLVQVGCEVAAGVGCDGPVVLFDLGTMESRPVTPDLLAIEPACIVAEAGQLVTLRGRHIAAPIDRPLCRQRGRNVALDILSLAPSNVVGGVDSVTLRPLGVTPGWAELEVERHSVLSKAMPLLVLPPTAAGQAVAAEFCEHVADGSVRSEVLPSFVREVGMVLDYMHSRGLGSPSALKASEAVSLAERLLLQAQKYNMPALAGLLRLIV